MDKFLTPAALARCLPFALFMVLLAIRGELSAQEDGSIDPRWLYGVSVLVVSGALFWFARRYEELIRAHWLTLRELLWSVLVGLGVFYLWIHMDYAWMTLGEPSATFRPVNPDGELQWGLIAIRWIGAALMVPVMEELFWRSFLMRWIDNQNFQQVDPKSVTVKALALSTLAFATAHTLWLAAIMAGLAYALLYQRTGKLWAPIVAHAVTNGVLGVWVVLTGNWQFW
jgi:uncharacterized protein